MASSKSEMEKGKGDANNVRTKSCPQEDERTLSNIGNIVQEMGKMKDILKLHGQEIQNLKDGNETIATFYIMCKLNS